MHSMYMITGATGGLGKAFAAECAARGWDLFLTDICEDRLAMLAQALERAHGVAVRFKAADLTDPVSRQLILTDVVEQGLRFRGLINVAGLDHEGFFMERSAEEITTILRLDIESALLTSPPTIAPEITLITADSRKVIPGALFVAYPGVSVDGHAFIADAIERGAAAIVGEREIAEINQQLAISS